jgi:FtsZ-binding cell division protein ZapB
MSQETFLTGGSTVMNTVEEKIAQVIEKVRILKGEKEALEKRNMVLQEALRAKEQEIERLASDKQTVKDQIEGLLSELENLEIK